MRPGSPIPPYPSPTWRADGDSVGGGRCLRRYRPILAGAEAGPAVAAAAPSPFGHVMVRVEDAEGHHARARERGARILQPPTDFPYGERQYRAEDPGGHHWVFSQSISDVDPKDWGGTLVSG